MTERDALEFRAELGRLLCDSSPGVLPGTYEKALNFLVGAAAVGIAEKQVIIDLANQGTATALEYQSATLLQRQTELTQ